MVAVKSKIACVFLKDTSQRDQVTTKPDVSAACVFLKDENGDVRLKSRAKAACVFLKGPEEKPKPAACVFLKAPEERPEEVKAACVFLKGDEQKLEQAACVFLKGEEKPEGNMAACVFLKGESQGESGLHPRPADVALYFGRLAAWDMSHVKKHAVRKGLFRADEIDGVELEYKRFMALGCVYGSNAVPLSQRIDDFWHAHILFTEDYAAMCQNVAGQFLHHRPTLDEDQVNETANFDLYEASFGAPSKAWL